LLGLLVVLADLSTERPASAADLDRSAQTQWAIRASHPITSETSALLYLPLLVRSQAESTPAPTPTIQPEPPREWDPRLDQRGAQLRPAVVEPGQGYWRLVKAVWFDEAESGQRHHIFVDALHSNGQRVVGLPVRVYWATGETTVTTQPKPGEAYAGDFAMFAIAPAYGARPNDGNPADEVWGMGLGSIELPFHSIHTSYGLTWRWTVASGPANTPTPTATPTPTPTFTPMATPTSTPIVPSTVVPEITPTPPAPTATPSPTRTPTATATPSATPTAGIDWDPRLTQRGATLQEVAVAPGQGYWKLVRAIWYNEVQAGNRQHILVDALDANGQRVNGVPVQVFWEGGAAGITTEAKPGEEYAANYPLVYPAPFYNAAPNDGNPADTVRGMGLGSLENPGGFIRASYGLTWQWTIKAAPLP